MGPGALSELGIVPEHYVEHNNQIEKFKEMAEEYIHQLHYMKLQTMQKMKCSFVTEVTNFRKMHTHKHRHTHTHGGRCKIK